MPALSDVAWIYVILTALYLFESFAWVSSGAVAIRSYFGRFRCPTRTHRLLGNDSGYLPTFGLAPFDSTFIVETCPVSLGREGVYGYVAASLVGIDSGVESGVATWLHCPWDRVNGLNVVERELRLDGKILCRVSDTQAARSLVESLKKIGTETGLERDAAISRFVSDQFDIESIRGRVDAWRLATRRLKLASLLLFIWIFLVGVARYRGWLPGFSDIETLPIYLAITLFLWWMCAGFLFRGHRRLYPELRGQRWKLFLTSLVSPAAAMRSVDHLARRLIGIAHPVALAAVVCSDEEVEKWAGRLARDFLFPRQPQGLPEGVAFDREDVFLGIVREYREKSFDAFLKFAEKRQIDLAPYRRPPRRDDPHAVGYCPRCHQEFSLVGSRCGQCGDMSTVEFGVAD